MDELVDALWPDDPPNTAEKTVQVMVSRLRRALGRAQDRLESPSGGYLMALDDEELDLARAERMAGEAEVLIERGDHAAAAQVASAALKLFRGPPLAELRGVDQFMGDVARAEELAIRLEHVGIDAEIAVGGADRVVGRLEVLVRDHPLRERFWAQLMYALYASGRQGEALSTYLRARTVLDEELGIEPGSELREAQQRILAQESLPLPGRMASRLGSEQPAPADSAPQIIRLPAPLDTIVGRDHELTELGELLAAHRLVTITGPGGIGKTRLAIEGARRVAGRFSGGIYFVDLSPIREPDLLLQVLAQAVRGARMPSGRLSRLSPNISACPRGCSSSTISSRCFRPV